MAITYNLAIREMETAPVEGGLENVVKLIHWMYVGEDGGYSGDAHGAVEMGEASSDSFTAFDDLTEEQVVAWVESMINLEKIQSDIAARIELQKNPPTIVKSNPWGGEDKP